MSQNLTELSRMDIDKLDKQKTVIVLGFAPVEQHGKHLPIGVDIYETGYWIKQALKKLEGALLNYKFLTLPVIPYGYANMKGFAGNMYISRKLLYRLVLETLNSIAQWGIKNLVIISGHADPMHLIAIEQACEAVNRRYGKIAFSPMGAIFSKQINSESDGAKYIYDKLREFPNDYHAGWIETSCMLAIDDKMVNNNYREQPNIEVKEKEMIFSKLVMKKTKNYGHIGYPKQANTDLGTALNEDMAEKMRICIESFILKSDYKNFEHHELYNLPFMKVW